MMTIAKTWLHMQIPNATVQLAGCTIYWQERNRDSGKRRRGGLCIYVHNEWCKSNIIDRYCSPDLDVMSIICRPFYLPRELTIVTVSAVYIPSNANVSVALTQLLTIVNKYHWTKLQTKIIKTWPDGTLSQLQDCFECTEWEVFV